MSIEYAPHVQNHINWLSHNSYTTGNNYPYDEVSVKNIHAVFAQLHKINQTSEDVWELWLTAERGPEEAFGDYEEMKLYGEVDNREDFEAWWKAEYPEEIQWFNLTAVERKDTGYKAIFLSNRFIIELDPRKSGGFEQDISEFTEWLLKQVMKCIDELNSGAYNRRVAEELPVQYRTGTIVRKDLHDLCPELRSCFQEELSQQEIDDFVSFVERQPEDTDEAERIQHLTAGEFYKFCSIGYKANNYSGCDKTPKEQYYLHADGRDGGLQNVDADSEEQFIAWLHDNSHFGVHPWEVCRGGNSTHISLYVYHNEWGFMLVLAGKSISRFVETIKFYLALRNYGIPVYLQNGEKLMERVLETELVGIVPKTVFPRYCESMFPGLDVIDFMHLPDENRNAIADRCTWIPEPQIALSV